MTYLTPQHIQKVQDRLAIYLEAERVTGVPWAMLVALHYRESDLGDRTARVGGPMQFDPPLTPEQVRAFGIRYSVGDLTDPETDLRTAIICAGAFCQAKAAALGKKLTPVSNTEDIADVAWSYNGRAYGSWQKSPYVSNDPANGVQLRITGTVPVIGNPSQRMRIDKIETRPGMLPVMRELHARIKLPAAPKPLPFTRVFLNGDELDVAKASIVGDKLYLNAK